MAYDEGIAERLREIYRSSTTATEKKMFGGIVFMVDGHMSCGVIGDKLLVRVGPQQYADSLKHPYVSEMDFTGTPSKGFVYVAPQGIEADDELASWVQTSLDFVRTLPAR